MKKYLPTDVAKYGQYFRNPTKARYCALYELSIARELRLRGMPHKMVARRISYAMNWAREALAG